MTFDQKLACLSHGWSKYTRRTSRSYDPTRDCRLFLWMVQRFQNHFLMGWLMSSLILCHSHKKIRCFEIAWGRTLLFYFASALKSLRWRDLSWGMGIAHQVDQGWSFYVIFLEKYNFCNKNLNWIFVFLYFSFPKNFWKLLANNLYWIHDGGRKIKSINWAHWVLELFLPHRTIFYTSRT